MKFKDKIKHYDQTTVTKTRFLTLAEQALLIASLKNISYTLFGGYDNAELKRAYINTDVDSITCFKILYNKQFLPLTHQNILGSLLSLNIEKDTIGDIIVEHECFFVISELKDYIMQEFTSIGRHSIQLEEIDGSTVNRTISLEEHTVFTDSMRLDLIVSKLSGYSRLEAKYLIENEMIKVNHTIATKPTRELHINDVLSIRKKGRFILLDNTNRSKKNKIVLKYGKFI